MSGFESPSLVCCNKTRYPSPAPDNRGRHISYFLPVIFNDNLSQVSCSYRSLKDVRTLNGETPLHIAVRANSLTAVRLLLGFHADLSQTSENGHMAMNCFQSEVPLSLA